MTEIRYTVVTRDGQDTVHQNAGEACNLDDTTRDEAIDADTADALLNDIDAAWAMGTAVRCQHCYGEAS